ncbi:MAG: hypothetical protein CSA31_02675 [Desulfobulbus propionicus]|nr:MAG: hypothetical protein CSA31_02675 [Desulfobulbus propionicus]
MSAIIGYTELALISSSKQEEVQEHLNHIFKASMRAKELVKQILTSCRHIHQPQQPQTIKVGSMIKEALKLIQSTFPSTIQIHTEIASSGKMVIDPGQMHQIIMNLCTNAKHAMQEDGGVLTIKVTDRDIEPNDMLLNRNPDVHPGAYICLSVDDTGHGMEPDIMKRIFEPYFTTKEKDVGTGLGLAMVHGITKSCGGAIMLESHVGKGTTFTLYFPRMDSESLSDELEEHTALAKCPTGSGRILIVDDEVEILSLGHVVLEDLGYQVVTKTNGMDALQEFSKQPDFFDAVITDITMPQMSGDKLAIELLRIRPEIPIIACTGFSEKINEQKATAIGIKALLAKPYTWKQLTKTLRMVLDENEPL